MEQGLPRKRRRPALSCVECRRRKIKCDRHEPCVHCVSVKLRCTYKAYDDQRIQRKESQQTSLVGSRPSPSTSPLAPNQRFSTNELITEHGSHVPRPQVAALGHNDTSNPLVEVRFADGQTEHFDLLVGADGQGSRTRKMMLGPGAADAFFPIEGVFVAYFTMPRPIQEGEEYMATMHTIPGRRGVMTRRNNPHELQVYLGCTSDSERINNLRRGDVAEQKEALAEIYQGAGGQREEIAKSLKDAKDLYFERMGIVKLDTWSGSRVTLVGDAGYCPSANTGMGTTSGMVGAYILAGEIGRHCGKASSEVADGQDDAKDALGNALKEYERKFRPFMDQVQEGVLENKGWNMIPSTPFGIAIMNCLLGVLSLFKVNIGKWMLKENVKGWELPDYEEMLRD